MQELSEKQLLNVSGGMNMCYCMFGPLISNDNGQSVKNLDECGNICCPKGATAYVVVGSYVSDINEGVCKSKDLSKEMLINSVVDPMTAQRMKLFS